MKSKTDFDQVFIENLKLPAIIGVHAVEQQHPQDIMISLVADIDISQAAKSDDIQQTVDYATICKMLEQYISQTCFKLVESLAENIANLLLDNFPIESLLLKISKKPYDIKNADAVGIQIKRYRR